MPHDAARHFEGTCPTVGTPAWKAFVEKNQWEPYLHSAAFLKHLQAEEKRLRAALTDLGLAKQ